MSNCAAQFAPANQQHALKMIDQQDWTNLARGLDLLRVAVNDAQLTLAADRHAQFRLRYTSQRGIIEGGPPLGETCNQSSGAFRSVIFWRIRSAARCKDWSPVRDNIDRPTRKASTSSMSKFTGGKS